MNATSFENQNQNNLDKTSTGLIGKQREKTQINKITNDRREISMCASESENIIRDYYEQLYNYEVDNLEEMHKFLETCNPKVYQEEIESLKRPITNKEIYQESKMAQQIKAQDQIVSRVNFLPNMQRINTNLLNFQKIEERRFSDSYHEGNITLTLKPETAQKYNRPKLLLNTNARVLSTILGIVSSHHHYKYIIVYII